MVKIQLLNQKKASTEEIQRNRKKVTIIGDSIVNGLEERGLGKKHIVKIRKHPGATTTDMIDYIKQVQRRKPDCIILHAGTNDIGKDEIDTIANMREIIQEKSKECPDTELVLSLTTTRNNQNGLAREVEKLNAKVKHLAKELKIRTIDHDHDENIDETCLSFKKLHLNKKGNSVLARNFLDFINEFRN